MKTKVSILFYVKREKVIVNGLVPIYTRITINGKRIESSSNRFVEISKWSTEAGKMKDNSEEDCSIKSHLDMLRIQIIDMQMELIHKKITVMAETLKSKILVIDERERMIIPIYQNQNDKIEELIANGYAYGTLERFKISLKHIEEFIFWKYSLSDISVNKIYYAFVTEFEFYPRSIKKCNNNTAVKYVKIFRKIIKIC